MSEYFRVLKRLEREQPDIEVEAVRPATGPRLTEQPPRSDSAPAARQPAEVAVPAAEVRAAFARLFDNIRALADGNSVRALVFAGASAQEPVGTVLSGLSTYVKECGFTVLTAELGHWSGRTILRSRAGSTFESGDGGPAHTTLDLGGPATPVELADWLQEAARLADLVLIEGRSLEESIDSALLARSCDGLVIVTSTGVTTRGALVHATERAQTVGCRTFGLVLHGNSNWTPRWLRRFFPSQHQRLTLPSE